MASANSIISISSSSLLNRIPQPKTTPLISLLKHNKDHEQRCTLKSSFTFTSLKISTPTTRRTCRLSCSASASEASTLPSALLFDCDGVLVDTEKDGHRISFNDTFQEVGIIQQSRHHSCGLAMMPCRQFLMFVTTQCFNVTFVYLLSSCAERTRRYMGRGIVW